MAIQFQFAAQEGRGEGYFTGANNVIDLDADNVSGGKRFTTADAVNVANGEGDVKHADIITVGGSAYYTTDGTAPDATVGFPLAAGNVMSLRNCRALIKTLKFFIPAGTTLKVSWIA